MADLFGYEVAPAKRKTNAWRLIRSAPKGEPVDLFIGIFNEVGEVRHDCWWNAEARIPDWYCRGEDGAPQIAAAICHWITHWKPAGTPDGPDQEDGGPPVGSRRFIDAINEESWPYEMRDRVRAYIEVLERGEIDPSVVGGDASQSCSRPESPRVELVVDNVSEDDIPW